MLTIDQIENGLVRAMMRNIRFGPSGLDLFDWFPLLIAAVVVWVSI